MSRISKAFQNKDAFIGYLTAGAAQTKDFLRLLDQGVNVLEVGIPYSDPVADGPVIQKAMHQALLNGTTPETVLEMIREIRNRSDVAIVLFTYLSPIQKDLEGFLTRAKKVGVDGVLVIDLPLEEADDYRVICEKLQLDPIFVISSTTSQKRIQKIQKAGKGFLYYACRKGTTGAKDELPSDLKQKVQSIKELTDLPVAVGFGISSRKSANEVLKVADGFVVGSHFVEGKTL